jgi:hypothetical protein
VNGTFMATTVTNLRTSSCTGSDGTYTKSRATYSGQATSSEPSLNGTATIDASSLVNSTTGAGTVSGQLQIDSSTGGHTTAAFEGVLTNGTVVGLAEGRSHPGGGETTLLANLSAGFSATGGFQNGKLGGGAGPGDAVLVTPGGCQAPKPPAPPKPDHVKAHGAITAAPSGSISVAGVTCTVPANLQAAVAGLATGTVVTIECDVANGVSTLTHVSGSGGDSGNGQGQEHGHAHGHD